MSKKEKFIEDVEKMIDKLSEEGKEFFEELKSAKVGVPKSITDKGKIILKDMQENLGDNKFKAKDIADRIGITGRSVSGSMRSLIALGYAEKVNQEPVMYGLTDEGINYTFDN